jgi:hypothetical protein
LGKSAAKSTWDLDEKYKWARAVASCKMPLTMAKNTEESLGRGENTTESMICLCSVQEEREKKLTPVSNPGDTAEDTAVPDASRARVIAEIIWARKLVSTPETSQNSSGTRSKS